MPLIGKWQGVSIIIIYQRDGNFHAFSRGDVSSVNDPRDVNVSGTWKVEEGLLCMSWSSTKTKDFCAYLIKKRSSYILYDELERKMGELSISSLYYD